MQKTLVRFPSILLNLNNSFVKAFFLRLGCLWLSTLRIHWSPSSKLPPNAILVLWHEFLPACIPAFSHRGIHVLISSSKDGEWAAKACSYFGYQVHRGSTSRNGSAGLRSLLRGREKGPGLLGMALDGPHGPRRQIKTGTLRLSHLIDTPIVPISVTAKHAFRLKSWDRCLIPWPFSKVEVGWGPPLQPMNLLEIENAMLRVEGLNFV